MWRPRYHRSAILWIDGFKRRCHRRPGRTGDVHRVPTGGAFRAIACRTLGEKGSELTRNGNTQGIPVGNPMHILGSKRILVQRLARGALNREGKKCAMLWGC